MKKLILISALLILSGNALAEIAIVVHPSNSNAIDANTVKRLYLGKSKSFPDGSQAVPVGQDEDSKVTTEFNEKVLGKSSSQVKAYWSKLIFTGKGTPPKQVANDAEVIKLVANNPNLIGYIDASKADGSVKVVAKF